MLHAKKALQRMYFYRKLWVFNVDGAFIQMFYSCFVELIFFSPFLADTDRSEEQRWLCRVWLKGAAKVAGLSLNDLTALDQSRV